MPVIVKSSYQAPFLYWNRHVNTIAHALLRRIKVKYKRQRIETRDEDFVDVDYSFIDSHKKTNSVVLVLHGLEGSSDSRYVKGTISAVNSKGWDAAVLNFRGCSGSDNKSFGSYHSGHTLDVNQTVNQLKNIYRYSNIYLVSYSLGANVMLKYLGEQLDGVKHVNRAVAISATCHLADSAVQLQKWYNKVYMMVFLKTLRKKVKEKCRKFPNHTINLKAAIKATTFKGFDDEYTAPAHGFKDAQEYWEKSSSIPYLPKITTPTLLINALDDPFLTPSCFPFAEAKSSESFYLETPKSGGHVGFISSNFLTGIFWHEKRTLEFLGTDY